MTPPPSEGSGGDSLGSVAQRLVAAATREFVQHGFEGASISRMVEAAGCNVRMIYHYFDNKAGLYRVCLAQAYDKLRQAEADATFWDLPPEQAITALVRFTFDYMVENPAFQGLMRIENMASAQQVRDLDAVNIRARHLFAAIDRVLTRGVADGVFTHRPDPGMLYLSILGLATIHVSNQHTMSVVLGRDLGEAGFLRARRAEVERVVLASLVTP